MTRQEAADFISGNIMWGKYKEGEPGEALSMAIRSLEAWSKVMMDLKHQEADNGWTREYQKGFYMGLDVALDIYNKRLAEVENEY